MTIVIPTALSIIGQVVTSGTAPYVDISDGDDNYAQLAPSQWTPSSRTSRATFRLPATTVCDTPTAVNAIIEGRWVATSGTTLPPDDETFDVIVFLNDAPGSSSSARVTEQSEGGTHHSETYVTESVPLLERDGFTTWPDVTALLAAGDLYLVLLMPAGADDYYDFRVTYAAVEFVCGIPPLRQNQRDDIRQGQRTSRQLTVRQVGYL